MWEISPSTGSRFEVRRVGVFKDDAAYNEVRGIYILTDRETGKEYVGVSGIGISELGQHPAGKTSAPDER
jgi:hypothetical protein